MALLALSRSSTSSMDGPAAPTRVELAAAVPNSGGVASEASAVSHDKPHLVFVMLDDVGFNDMGYQSTDVLTPFMDQLCAEGVRLTRLYGQEVCTPSRAAMLTGKLPIHLELQHWQVSPSEPWGMPTKVATLPQYLKVMGYATHARRTRVGVVDARRTRHCRA